MLSWRHWFKREVVIPAGMLILSGVGLAWLAIQLMPLIRQPDFRWLLYTFLCSVGVYALFAYVTMRHVLSTYTLERFDPGNPDSVKRLSRMTRFNYPDSKVDPDILASELVQALQQAGFSDEADHPIVGRVLTRLRPNPLPILFRPRRERVFLVEKTPINVFIVDFTIRDTLRFIDEQTDAPSDDNLLVFITREPQLLEAASAAAGVVNFLGRTDEGILGALLFDSHHSRLYFPIDQTLMPFLQRHFFRRTRKMLIAAIRKSAEKPVEVSP